MKKYKINKWWQIVERNETDDGLGVSVSPWLVRLIWLLLVLTLTVKLIQFLSK